MERAGIEEKERKKRGERKEEKGKRRKKRGERKGGEEREAKMADVELEIVVCLWSNGKGHINGGGP